MAEPGTDPAGGQEAPPPPPPPPQTETVDTAGSHATTPPQPPQTETVGPGPVPTPPLQNQTAAQPQVQPQPRPQTGTGEVAGQPRTPQPPSQVRASAADAEKQPPAPSSPPPKKPAHQTEVPKSLQPPEGGVAGDAVDKPTDSMQLPRGSRLKKMFQKKGRLVRCLMSWYGRHRSREEPVDKAAAAQKEKGEGTKPSTPARGDAIEKQLPRGRGCRLKEMFQKKGRLIRYLMSWYRPYRSREEPMDNAAARKEKGEGTKPSTSAQEEGKVEEIITKQPSTPARGDKQLPCGSRLNELFQKKGRLVGWLMSWYRRHRTPNEPAVSKVPASAEEGKSKEAKDEGTTELQRKVMVSLEEILEEAFDGLLAADLGELSDKDRECLLTFSVFALASDVKKQAVTYWWATQFELHYYLSSDDVFKKLCGDGFLEPIKNRCSQVIHGCRVNPLVHWMVKRRARPKFADLDERGDPTDKQPNSEVLCLTAGNRIRLQRLPKAKGESKAARKLPPTTTNKAPIPQGQPAPAPAQNGETRPEEVPDAAELRKELKNKKVILNVSANVYRLPGLLLSESDLADRLVVLQLGRWWNSDDKTYMEVDGLESLRAIGNLKNLRYLSLRGLSQLKELPSEIRQLDRLAILDVRGCQNLVKVASKAIDTLKKLTHLDLTECYLLEHIGRGVTSLTELRVFKGFVFGVGPERWSKCCRSKVCRLHDLCKLKKLQKLSVNVTTDAKVDKGEMANLKGLDNLRSLTVTWGELPSILDEKEKEKEKKELLDNWTGLVLPRKLEKLDVRCFPEEVIPQRWFDRNDTLKKLYVRGGAVMKLEIPKNSIEILRLRYLKHFEMSWTALHEMLKAVKYVEVVIKDPKVMKIETQVQEDPQKKVQEDPQKVKEEQTTKKKKAKEKDLRLMADMKKKMGIPGSTLDENGVWVRDAKEEENKKGEGTQGGADKSNVPEPSDAAPAPAGKVPKSEAHKTEAAPGAAEVPREAGKGGGDAGKAQTAPPSSSDENKAQGEEGGQGGSLGGAEEADGPPTKEDGGDAPEVPGEVKKVDGGDAGKARTEGEGGQGGRPTTPRVSEKDGVDDDTSPADAARSPAAPQPPELPRRPDVPDVSSPSVSDLTEDASAKPVQANASASGTTPPPVPPATSTTAKPKEPGKADDDDGSN